MEHTDAVIGGSAPIRLLKRADICSSLAISPAKFYKLVSEGAIPRPLKIGRAARWKASDIQAFVQACGAEKSRTGEACDE